ncbi:Ubiquitin-associated/translation elongation factor EF1B N-terminal eukaryote [Penicillium maclennaniae]|uniref:Ubiquitin-associated/translation elongation factor EF1B N-terminal eukaryote n=1 Tax=Penicillium maclennaniae TaxID=1343394 RepID=UPI0025423B77|nr:Ubiquitin-associated/translation elongation factor EF1B N-terminal eukaryote [Penicillium maclennaniae]KAJ5665311.1 Ubiquitin-associated/translation elongation factor EF1B N-terminal eukaryote [Penicillium maclennaniae]
MDDLNGLSWSNNSNGPPSKPPPMGSGLLFPSIRSNGGSGRSTPMSAASNRTPSPSKPAPSTGDSFANLVSFNSTAANKNISLAEQEKRLKEEKAQKEAEKRRQYEAQYGGQNNQFWDGLEQGRTQSPAAAPVSQTVSPPIDDDDLLAAFNAAAPVDASTNFPIPSSNASPQIGNTPQVPLNGGISIRDNTGGSGTFEDDDPFGLNELKPKSAAAPPQAQDDEYDFLGLLGKPVSEIPRQRPSPSPPTPTSRDTRSQNDSPMPTSDEDRAIAELVEMGFPADKSRQALRTTPSGKDVQAAVGWLLTQAHAESRQKSQGQSPSNAPSHDPMQRSSRQRDAPSWAREGRSETSRRDDSSPGGEKDPAQLASQLGNNLWKTAGSLWKTGSKRFQQAVNEFNTGDHDPSQPKWMRDASASHEEPFPPQQPPRRGGGRPEQPQQKPQNFTDEAMLLEAGNARPPRKSARPDPRGNDLRQQSRSPAQHVQQQQPSFLQKSSRPTSTEPKSRLSRFATEEQSAQAYVSSARRKRPQATPPVPEPAIDLFDSPAPSSQRPKPAARSQGPTPARSTPIPVRPKVPTRSIPPVSADALQSTHRHREKAAESYKRGDYAAAYESFSTALNMLPDKHPITIMIRSNRAMTALKTGEAKSAVDDADTILSMIGPSKGESETIDIGNGEPAKQMKDFYGKALMRKAEALEQLEKWGDAAQVWKLAVEAGHGGSTSIQGRNRCEKAAGISRPAAKAVPVKKRAAPAPKKASALSDLGAGSAQDSEAVSRLREANKASELADEEKFALSESVDAKIALWKNGKQDNLRALLGSLDSVLWADSGWKKIGLAELVLPNKVKIQYMKGIAKVHPDKIPTTATTEQRMISSAVFGTLNEAWDKFRVENNL